MTFLRNPEVKRDIIIYTVMLILIYLSSTLFDISFGYGLAIWFVLSALHFFITYLRYKKINKLNYQIDSIVNGKYISDFNEYKEGELAVLADEVYKVLSRLTEQEEMLRNDKIVVMDSVADISHQLRTPLTSINILLSMLNDPEITDEKRHKTVREIKSQLGRIEWLIEALLKISKLDAEAVKFSKESISLKKLVMEAYDTVSIPMELKGISFELEGEDGIISADKMWLLEAISNILKNAMEHTPSEGFIKISLNTTNIYKELVIMDSGEGFSQEDIPHLFERFYKGKNSSDSSFGIGLCLAKKIIVSAGGTIKAENYSEGARFIIKFYESSV